MTDISFALSCVSDPRVIGSSLTGLGFGGRPGFVMFVDHSMVSDWSNDESLVAIVTALAKLIIVSSSSSSYCCGSPRVCRTWLTRRRSLARA